MSVRSGLILALALALAGALNWVVHRPIVRADGMLVAADPAQTAPRDAATIARGDYTLKPLADYAIEARVLSRAEYSFDAGSALSPTDFALGWRGMSDSAVIAQLDIEQSARFFSYRWRNEPPLPPADIVRSSANVHLIPADAGVKRSLDRVRVGTIVTLRGQLVEATRVDGWRWVSSLTREDTGAGACELMLVREVERRD